MFPYQDLPEVLPVFPLPGALLLPRARLPLQIFEPRYLAMLDDVLKTKERLIGMVQPIGDNLHTVGCAGRLVSFAETDDGRYMITLQGVSRFEITSEVEGFTPYRRANVNWGPFRSDLGTTEKDENFDRSNFLQTLRRYFDEEGLSTEWESMEMADVELLVNSLSMLCPFEPEDKQALLEASTLEIRRQILTTLMEYALAGGGENKLQ